MGKLIIFFCTLPTHCPGLGIWYSATAELHCRATAPAVTPAPPAEGMRASVSTYTLGQGVRENSASFFYKGNLGVQFFLPAGGAPQWEGGEGTATYVLQAHVLFICIFFWGRSGILLLMYARVHTCACVCCVVSMQVCLP